jgi:hypothetical protein
MFSRFVTELIRESLKERYRGFALWLFWSEIILALVLALVSLGGDSGGALLSLILAWYAAFTCVQWLDYEAKWKRRAGQNWRPGLGSRIIRVCAYFPTILFGFGIAYSAFWDKEFVFGTVMVIVGLVGLIGTYGAVFGRAEPLGGVPG